MPARKALCLFLATRFSSFSHSKTVLQQATAHVCWIGMVFCWLNFLQRCRSIYKTSYMWLPEADSGLDLVWLYSVFGGFDFVHLIVSQEKFFVWRVTVTSFCSIRMIWTWWSRCMPQLPPWVSAYAHTIFLRWRTWWQIWVQTRRSYWEASFVRSMAWSLLVCSSEIWPDSRGNTSVRMWFVLSRPVPICCQAWGEQYLAKTVSTMYKFY